MNEATVSHPEPSPDAPIFSRFMDDEIYVPLLVEFAADLPGHVAELALAIERRAYAETGRLSHRLKGAAATYGYPELSSLAGAAEDAAGALAAGTADDPARLDVLAAAMSSVCDRICLGTKLRNPTAPLQ